MCWRIRTETFLRELCQYHVSGQLKVAPEHVSDSGAVTRWASRSTQCLRKFTEEYKKMNEKLRHKAVSWCPISCPPIRARTMKEAVELAEYLRDLGYMPEQVQDFYPTPSTISTCMYYTGL